ncbi:MAG: hypothetical protein GY760_12115 [Deltaproteobacteria bacterium]|nr:hypothetical protein [Deltaproteobacteria bacterium]
MSENKKKSIFIALCLLIIVCSYFFEYSGGFVSTVDKNGTIHYVSDLYGSGADDNIVVFFGFFIFLLPLVVRLIRIRRKLSVFEYLLLLACVAIQIYSLIYGIDAGNYWLTITEANNSLLLALTIFYASSFIWSLINIINTIYYRLKKNN